MTVYDVNGLMEVLHIGKTKAYALMKNKAFPSRKVGGTWLITERALTLYLERSLEKCH